MQQYKINYLQLTLTNDTKQNHQIINLIKNNNLLLLKK
jgi:hypothetical protein